MLDDIDSDSVNVVVTVTRSGVIDFLVRKRYTGPYAIIKDSIWLIESHRGSMCDFTTVIITASDRRRRSAGFASECLD
jgi:hypothetical protein